MFQNAKIKYYWVHQAGASQPTSIMATLLEQSVALYAGNRCCMHKMFYHLPIITKYLASDDI